MLGVLVSAVDRCVERMAEQQIVQGAQELRPRGAREERLREEREAPACPGWAPQGLAPAARQERAPPKRQGDRLGAVRHCQWGRRWVPVKKP